MADNDFEPTEDYEPVSDETAHDPPGYGHASGFLLADRSGAGVPDVYFIMDAVRTFSGETVVRVFLHNPDGRTMTLTAPVLEELEAVARRFRSSLESVPVKIQPTEDYEHMDFSAVQARHKEWAYRNFGPPPLTPSLYPFLGLVEEVGELSHALLKQAQGIRGTHAEHEANAKDSVGDCVLFLCDLCSRRGWDLQEIVEDTTAEVWKRDWIKKKADGVTA